MNIRPIVSAFVVASGLWAGVCKAQSDALPHVDAVTSYSSTHQMMAPLKSAGSMRARDTDGSTQLANDKARLKREYERRVQTDGKADADRWLSGAALALGERDGRAAAARRSR